MQGQARLGYCGLAAIVAVAWLGLAGAAFAQDDVADQPIKAYVCKSDTGSVDNWRNTVSWLIARAFATKEGAKVRVIGAAECGALSVEVACSAGVYDQGGPVMVCSPDTFLKLLRTGAWYAVQHAAGGDEDYETFRRRKPARLGPSAFAASVQGNDAAIDAQVEQLRAELEALPIGETGSRTAQMFQAIETLVFAALIGHESAHLETQPPYCALDTKSRMEESGVWAVVQRVDSSDELFQPQTPEIGEIRADRCGMRRIRSARDMIEQSKLSVADQAFARRAAADIVSTILLVRMSPGQKPVMGIDDAYLYPPLRIVSLAGEINAGFEPVVCGGAAENLVQAFQLTMQARPANGIIPDEIEHVFPQGVIDAWNGAPWSQQAYACQ